MTASAEVRTSRWDLITEFAEILPRTIVESEVAAAERELHGQVPAEALPEMLHRLILCRLQQRLQQRSQESG